MTDIQEWMTGMRQPVWQGNPKGDAAGPEEEEQGTMMMEINGRIIMNGMRIQSMSSYILYGGCVDNNNEDAFEMNGQGCSGKKSVSGWIGA